MKAGQKRKGSKLATGATPTKRTSPAGRSVTPKRRKAESTKSSPSKKNVISKAKSPKRTKSPPKIKSLTTSNCSAMAVEQKVDVNKPPEAIRLSEALQKELSDDFMESQTVPVIGNITTPSKSAPKSLKDLNPPIPSCSVPAAGLETLSQCGLCRNHVVEPQTIYDVLGVYSDVAIEYVNKIGGRHVTQDTLICSDWCQRLLSHQVELFKQKNEKLTVHTWISSAEHNSIKTYLASLPSLETELDNSGQLINELLIKVEEHEAENSRLRAEMSSRPAQNTSEGEEVNLEGQITALLKSQAKFNLELQQVRQEKDELRRDLSSKDWAIATKEKLRAEAEKKAASLKADLDEQIKVRGGLERERTLLTKDKEQLVAELNSLKQQNENLSKSDSSEKFATLTIEKRELEERVHRAESERRKAEDELTSTRQKLDEARKEVDETIKDYMTIYDGNNALSIDAKLSLYHQKLKEDLTAKRVMVRQMLIERYQNFLKFENLESEKKKLEDEISNALQERDGKVASLNGELAQLKTLLKTGEDQRDKLLGNVKELKDQVSKLTRQLGEKISSRDVAKMKQNHQTELAELKRAHAKEIQQFRDDSAKTVEQLDKYVVKFQELEKRVFLLATDFAETLKDLETEPTVVPLPKENSGIDDKMTCLGLLVGLSAELLQAKLDEIKKLRTKSTQPATESVQKMLDEALQDKTNIQNELTSLRQQLICLQTVNEELKSSSEESADKLNQTIQSLNGEIFKLKNLLANTEERELSLKTLNEKLSLSVTEFVETKRNLNEKLKLKKGQVDNLEAECCRLNAEVENLKTKLAAETERADRSKSFILASMKNAPLKVAPSNSSAQVTPMLSKPVTPSTSSPAMTTSPPTTLTTNDQLDIMVKLETVPLEGAATMPVTSSTANLDGSTTDAKSDRDRMCERALRLFDQCLERFTEDEMIYFEGLVKKYQTLFLETPNFRRKLSGSKSLSWLQKTEDILMATITSPPKELVGKEWLLKLMFCKALWHSMQIMPACVAQVVADVEAFLQQN